MARSPGRGGGNHRHRQTDRCKLHAGHQQNLSGKTYAAIDAVSKPTKKVAPSGEYDPAAERRRYQDWKLKQGGGQKP